jgi:nitrile hydratase
MHPIHDAGGTDNTDPVVREADEPPFHHEWETRVFVLNRLLLGTGIYNLDEFRYAIEKMPAEAYVATSYYEKWLLAIERLLREKGALP